MTLTLFFKLQISNNSCLFTRCTFPALIPCPSPSDKGSQHLQPWCDDMMVREMRGWGLRKLVVAVNIDIWEHLPLNLCPFTAINPHSGPPYVEISFFLWLFPSLHLHLSLEKYVSLLSPCCYFWMLGSRNERQFCIWKCIKRAFKLTWCVAADRQFSVVFVIVFF